MKKSLQLCILVSLCLGGAVGAWAADPGDRFLEAYFLIQEGDAAVHDSDWTKANLKYSGALDILNEIKTESPDWNPHIIEFRTKYIADHLASLKTKLAQPPAPPQPQPAATTNEIPAPQPIPPVVSTIATNPATAAESEQVRQLTSELQRAHEQVEQLEAARNELNAKLQEQLSKVAPTQTTPQIEELLKTNQDLAAKLAAAQTQIAEARERAAAVPAVPTTTTPTATSDLEQLRSELAQARGELQQTKEELQQTRLELGTTKQALEKAQTDNTELRRSYEEVIGQLTDANKKLTAVKAGSDKDDEIIRQLRKENALLRIIAERKASDSATTGESEETTNGPSIPELRGWRPRPRAQPVVKAPPPPKLEEPKPEPKPTPPPSSMEESSRGKLVATLTAPKKAEPTNETVVAEPPKPQTNAPAKPPAPATPPAPAKPPAPVKKTPPPAPKKETAEPAEAAPKDQEKEKPQPAAPAPPDVRKLLNEGRAALALKDFDTAAGKYNAALDLEPTNSVALANLGVIRYQQNRLDDAENYLRKAAVAAPNDSNTRSLLGVVYFRKGAIEDAYAELNRAVAIDPHNAEAHNYLGIVLSEKGWGASGELEIRRAIEMNPQYADAHFNLAVVYAKQRNPKVELARYHYKKALDLGAKPDPELEALLKKLSEKPAAPADGVQPKP
ncbi:MAG TPA: tetratricopeptide repeat protein [Verrucomicrobiae bacterium]|nr:tetratricopeptide repeat protein [Verrucomicrobiae bacterium]